MSVATNLNSVLGRISTPAKEVRDMLVLVVDSLLSAAGRGGGGGVGTCYWVDGVNGSNSNSGLNVASPKLTITTALALCEDNKNDYIFVIDYWQPTGEAWPIVVNKQQVHIVGLALGNLPYPAIHPTGVTAAFELTSAGQYGSIENLTIGGGGTGGGITIGDNGQVDGFLIKKCTFGHAWFGTPLNGIQQKVGSGHGGYSNRIEECLFLGDLANITKGAITGNAIDLLNVTSTAVMMYGTQIINNIFMGCAIGVNFARASDSVIVGNKFTCADAADGEAVTLSALCLGSMIDGNRAMKGATAVTYNPFKDLGTNHWGLNHRAGVSILPVTS